MSLMKELVLILAVAGASTQVLGLMPPIADGEERLRSQEQATFILHATQEERSSDEDEPSELPQYPLGAPQSMSEDDAASEAKEVEDGNVK